MQGAAHCPNSFALVSPQTCVVCDEVKKLASYGGSFIDSVSLKARVGSIRRKGNHLRSAIKELKRRRTRPVSCDGDPIMLMQRQISEVIKTNLVDCKENTCSFGAFPWMPS